MYILKTVCNSSTITKKSIFTKHNNIYNAYITKFYVQTFKKSKVYL